MDLSSVRLSAFEKPRLALTEVNAAIREEEPETSGRDSVESVHFEDDVVEAEGTRDVALSDTFRASMVAGQPALLGASSASVHVASGFALAVTEAGTAVWRFVSTSTSGSPRPLVFPSSGNALAELVSPIPGSIEPGVVIIEPETGVVRYWENVDASVTEDLLEGQGAGVAKISLGRDEAVTQMCLIEPAGIAVATSSGAFVLVNLRDSLGKRSLRVTQLRSSGSGLLRFFGSGSGNAWKNIVCISAGTQVNESERLVYLANSRGDVAVWRCGVDGTASLVAEAPVGALLHDQMDKLYPNAGPSLQILDMAVSPSRLNVLASFSPTPNDPLRYYLLVTLLQNDLTSHDDISGDPFAIECILRLQTYETQTLESFGGHLVLPENGSAVFASFDDALVMVEPRRAVNEARWEETLALKSSVLVLGCTSTKDGIGLVLDKGIVEVTANPPAAREPGASAEKTRLEQAVFFARPTNPFDLERWSANSFGGENNATEKAVELSREIANATSRYIASHLPSLKAHLELRLDRLVHLVKFVEHNHEIDPQIVGEVLSLGAALAIWTRADSNESLLKELVEFARPIEVHDWFVKCTDRIPNLLDWLAKRQTAVAADALVAALVATDEVAQRVEQPHPGFTSVVVSKIERLVPSAIASKDTDRLELLVVVLCVAYHNKTGAINLTDVLRDLATFGARRQALALAERFQLWAAYARILGDAWLSAPADSVEQKEAEEEVRFLLDHLEQGPETKDLVANEFFGFLVDSKQTRTLLKHFVPTHREAVVRFLESRGLQSVAWTVDPPHSAALLQKATESEQSLQKRKVLAALTKLAAVSNRNSQLAKASEAELRLIAAREIVQHQISYGTGPVIEHISKVLGEGRLLTREEVVDALSFLPSRSSSTPSNIARAFALVRGDDLVRQRVLIQQLVVQTPWQRFSEAETDDQRNQIARETVWYSTAKHLKPAYIARLNDSSFWQASPSPAEVSETYTWIKTATERDRLLRELEMLSLDARRISAEYNVDRWSRATTAAATSLLDVEESTMITA